MTAVYIHFPYCLRRCAYCDFPTAAARTIPRRRYRDAVLRELDARLGDLELGPVASVFFGGGTPSLWGAEHVGAVLGRLGKLLGLRDDAEITLEANPGAAEAGDLDGCIAAGVNRISIGVQALDDRRLRALGRVHDRAGALATLGLLADRLTDGRLRSASADLLLGAPGQGIAELRADLEGLLDFGLPHLSVYALTVEPGTPLSVRVRRGLAAPPDEELQADMLALLPSLLRPHRLRRYEVSNHALPGHESRHNLAYWKGRHYLAAGAGAHGFVPAPGRLGRRYGNHRNVRAWFAALEAGRLPEAFAETIDPGMHLDERVLTGMRLAGGLDLGPLRAWAGDGAIDAILRRAEGLQAAGAGLAVRGDRLVATEEGMLGLDGLIVALLG